MPQQAVELILLRQLASYLSIPLFIMGPDEKLLFYNEAAETLVGQPFAEAEQMALDDLGTIFQVVDEHGSAVPRDRMPLTVALRERRPVHVRLRGQGLDGTRRTIELTAFPLQGQAGRHLGAVAIFWEVDGP